MTEPDDLFSFLDEPSRKPARPIVPSLADSLRDEGLLPCLDGEEPVSYQPDYEKENPLHDLTQIEPMSAEALHPEANEPEEVVAPEAVEIDEPVEEEGRAPCVAPVPESVSSVVEVVAVHAPNFAQRTLDPVSVPDSRLHRKLLIGSGAVIGFAIAGGLLTTYIHKESAPAITLQAPQSVAPPASIPEPVATAEPAVALVAVVQEPETAKAPEVEPVAPGVSQTPAAPKRTKPPRPVAKPAPEQEQKWQDDAMEALDDLEKRL